VVIGDDPPFLFAIGDGVFPHVERGGNFGERKSRHASYLAGCQYGLTDCESEVRSTVRIDPFEPIVRLDGMSLRLWEWAEG
jgi:hypothetical protein